MSARATVVLATSNAIWAQPSATLRMILMVVTQEFTIGETRPDEPEGKNATYYRAS